MVILRVFPVEQSSYPGGSRSKAWGVNHRDDRLPSGWPCGQSLKCGGSYVASTIPAHVVTAVTVLLFLHLVGNETITKHTNEIQRRLNGKQSSGKTQREGNRKYLGKVGLQF